MLVIAALVGGAALLLLGAGAAKVADPSRTAGALAARGWPSSPALVRAGATAEAALGAAALVVGGPVVAALVAASYVAFTFFVVGALRADAPVGTCGCFGRPDTPPRVLHAAIDAALALGAAAGAIVGVDPLVDAGPLAGLAAVGLAAAAYLGLTRRSGVSHRGRPRSQTPEREGSAPLT